MRDGFAAWFYTKTKFKKNMGKGMQVPVVVGNGSKICMTIF
jgi:hypothetical protein